MINKNKLVTILVGILTAIGSIAQERIINDYPDTVSMTVDGGVELTFAFTRISRKSTYYTNELWKSTLNVMQTAVENSSIQGGKLVTYQKVLKDKQEVAKVGVIPLTPKETYLISTAGTNAFDLNRIEFNLIKEDLFISFSLNDFADIENIKELSIETLWDQIEQKFKDEGSNNLYGGKGVFRYGNAQLNELGTVGTGKDNIEITFFGVGLGYYRDRFVPDLGSKLSFHIQDRLGNEWMEFGVLYTQQYFFSRKIENSDYDLDINGWLTGFWKFSSKINGEFGVGIGSLIHRDGDFFKGSTWKMSIYSQPIKSRFSFSPEIIFTNDFKDAFPALRVGLTF